MAGLSERLISRKMERQEQEEIIISPCAMLNQTSSSFLDLSGSTKAYSRPSFSSRFDSGQMQKLLRRFLVFVLVVLVIYLLATSTGQGKKIQKLEGVLKSKTEKLKSALMVTANIPNPYYKV